MAAMKTLTVLAASMVQPSSAAHLRTPGGHIATIAVHNYEKDCGLTQPISLSAAKARIPGAGMSPDSIDPFVNVLKDSFYQVDCVADYMFTHGDKFGDHSDEYLLGDVSNVSIVHYAAHVPKEDRDEMTHEVCFAFCRTVPDMNFFGINNGRECYCMTYYQAMADDSSLCDAPCDGNVGTMCGGKSKSSIFGMHACDNTASKLETAKGQMSEVGGELDGLHTAVKATKDAMQSMAAEWQQLMGKAGDPGSADLAQTAKEFAGELEHAAGVAEKIGTTIGDLEQSASGLDGANFKSSAVLTDAEKSLQDMQEATTRGAAAIEELEQLQAKASPNVTGQVNATHQYYPIMYFVDKRHGHIPSTCTGTPAGKPIVGSLKECAEACNGDVHDCVGFQYFPGKVPDFKGIGLCFTFSKMKTVNYWTGCRGATDTSSPPDATVQAEQIQADEFGPSLPAGLESPELVPPSGCAEDGDKEIVRCAVKFAEFEGNTLKPDPSGKCKVCLKEANRLDRFFH